MSVNEEFVERERVDYEDILRCSYDNDPDGAVINRHHPPGREAEEISVFGEPEEFADILRCSYEKPDYEVKTGNSRYSNYRNKVNDVEDIPRKEVLEGAPYYHDCEPVTAAVAMEQNQPVTAALALPPQLGDEGQLLPSIVDDNEQGRRGSILSQIHLFSENGMDDISCLPNDDVIYDRAHGINNSGILLHGDDAADGGDHVNNVSKGGGRQQDQPRTKKKKDINNKTAGRSHHNHQHKVTNNNHYFANATEKESSIVRRYSSLSDKDTKTKELDSKEKKEPNDESLEDNDNGDTRCSSESKKSLYAAILARKRTDRESQCSESSAEIQNMRRDKSDNEKPSAPSVPSISSSTSIVHSISGLDIISTPAPSSTTNNISGYHEYSKKTIRGSSVNPERRMIIEENKHVHGITGNNALADDDVSINNEGQVHNRKQDVLMNHFSLDGSNSSFILKEPDKVVRQNPQDGTESSVSKSLETRSMDVSVNTLDDNSPDARSDSNDNSKHDVASKRIPETSSSDEEELADDEQVNGATSATRFNEEGNASNANNVLMKEVNDTKKTPSSPVAESQQQHSHPPSLSQKKLLANEYQGPFSDCGRVINSNEGNKEGLDVSQKTTLISNVTPRKPSNCSQDSSQLRSNTIDQRIAQQSSSAVDALSLGSSLPNIDSHDSCSLPIVDLAATGASVIQPYDKPQQYNGWDVPLGVHKIICSAPGLSVTTQVHRRSSPVMVGRAVNAQVLHTIINGRRKKLGDNGKLIIPPGCYVEILETRVHGKRVRGRICWEIEVEAEEEIVPSQDGKNGGKKKKIIIRGKTSMLKKQTSFRSNNARTNTKRSTKLMDAGGQISPLRRLVKMYEGWISLQWANTVIKNHNDAGVDFATHIDNDLSSSDMKIADVSNDTKTILTDEDSGPWTQPVPLGVYRIDSGGGPLALRDSPEPNSAVLGKLYRGRCVEVIQTQVKCDQVVRARVFVPQHSFSFGWVDLLNASRMRNSSSLLLSAAAALPVPLGAYIVISDEPGCVITEGGRLDSKEKGTLGPGSCMEVVATRLEESGVVRGLIAGGGHVTLLIPPRADISKAASFDDLDDSRKKSNIDEGQITFAMPVPIGRYQIMEGGISVSSDIIPSPSSPLVMKLPLNATVKIIKTHVISFEGEGKSSSSNSRVRGRVVCVVVANEDGSFRYSSSSGSAECDVASGWMTLFEVQHNRMRMYAHPQKQ